MNQSDVIALITTKARAYAAQQGSPAEGDSFARVAVAIAFGESSLNPNAIRNTSVTADELVRSGRAQREQSVGLFQNNRLGGRGSGYSVEQLRDPNLNIDISLPQLWGAFQRNGGATGFARDPITVTARTYQQGQRSIAPSVSTQVAPGLALTGGGLPPTTGDGNAAPRTRPTGGPNMVNQPSTQPRAVDPDIEAIIKTSRDAYTQATAERARLQAAMAKPGVGPQEMNNLETQFTAAQARELAEADNYRQALALRMSANKPGAQGQQDTPLDYARYDLEVTKAENEVTQAGWSNELALLKYMDESNRGWASLARGLLEGNREDVREAIKIANDQGALRLQASAAVLDAHVKQQAAELARAGAILERAKFIREGFELLATRLLPAGTDYQPGFEPSGALNQALAANNVPTLTIRTVQTPLAYLDPREQLRMSDESLRETGYGRPNLNPQIQGVEREYSTIRNLTPYTAQAITPAQVGLRTPGATGEDGTPLAAPTFLSPAAAARTFWDDLAREQPPAPGEPAAGEPPGSAAQPAGTLPLGVDATVAPYQQPSGSQPLVGGPINWAGPQQPVTPDRQQPAGAYPNPGGQNSPNPDRRDQQRFSTSVTRAQGAVTAAVGAAVPQIATPAPTGPVLQPRPAGPVPGPSPARNLNAPQANEIVYRDPVTGEYVVGGVRFQPGRTVGSLRGSA